MSLRKKFFEQEDGSFVINETIGQTPDFEWYEKALEKIDNMNITEKEKKEKKEILNKEFDGRYKINEN